jgi:hypothetical protein
MALGKSETLKQIILSWAAFGSQTFSSGCLPGPFIAISFTNFSLGTFCMGTAPLESSQGMCCLLLFHLVICFLRMRGTCCNGTSCSMTSWTHVFVFQKSDLVNVVFGKLMFVTAGNLGARCLLSRQACCGRRKSHVPDTSIDFGGQYWYWISPCIRTKECRAKTKKNKN